MITYIAKILNFLAAKNRFALSSLILLALTLVIFFVIFPEINVDNQVTLDSRAYYSVNEAYEVISSYSQSGRNIYVATALILDIIFPILYSLLFGTFLTFFLHDLIVHKNSWYFLRLFPFLGGLSDIIENISISFLIIQLPERIPVIALLASLFTIAKWIFFVSSVVSIIIFGIRWLKRSTLSKGSG